MPIATHLNDHSGAQTFARVDAEIMMALRIVPKEEHGQVQSRFHTQQLMFEPLPMDVRDTALAEWLSLINRKLDAILKMLEEREDSLSGMTPHRVNIGAGGITFRTDTELHVGDLVEIKLRFFFDKPVVLSVIGKTVSASPDAVVIQFISMTDEMRDLIVRFVFQREREIMQSQRKD